MAAGQVRRLRQGASAPRTPRTPCGKRSRRSERPHLVAYRGRFDGFHALPASVSKTCLVRFDTNKGPVNAKAVGRPVEIHAYADRIVIRQDGVVVGEHARSLRARQDDLRSMALRARAGSQAGGAAQRRAVHEILGVAPRARSAYAASLPVRRTATACGNPCGRAHGRIAGGRSRLRAGAERGRSFRGRCSQHSGATTRSRSGADNPHPGRASSSGTRRSPIAPATIN